MNELVAEKAIKMEENIFYSPARALIRSYKA
jgi:hypothetical protein